MDLAEAVATYPLGPTEQERRVEWEVAVARHAMEWQQTLLLGPPSDEETLRRYRERVLDALERGDPVPDA